MYIHPIHKLKTTFFSFVLILRQLKHKHRLDTTCFLQINRSIKRKSYKHCAIAVFLILDIESFSGKTRSVSEA